MRKADYQALANIIAKHRREALTAAQHTNDPALHAAAMARIQACKDIARDFTKVANVSPYDFLIACGIEP